MAAKNERSAKLSILDRLIDNEPKRTSEPPPNPAQSLRELKASLRRDIEWLFNTRRCIQEPPEGSLQLQRSLYVFGLPDVGSVTSNAAQEYARLARTMEATLAVFEPRLRSIRVTPVPSTDTVSRVLRFQVEGALRLEPVPEHVMFDTVLELTSGEFEVKGEPGAR